MAINFPDSPTNGQVATVGGKNYTYNSTKNTWTPTQVTEADLSTVGSTTVVATHDLLPASPSAGDMALVSSVNKMYVYFLSGWWLMSSLQNASPSGITGNAAIYDLAADGTPTTVTLSSSDPEGFPIVWSHSVISGSLGGTTVTNVNNVFTITPSTDAADAGTFTLRFAASDGQGGESGSQSQFTLDFVFIVTNSRYTTLLATATGTSDNNNITDASTNNHTITVNGDAHAGTFSPYRSGGYSTYFDGNDYLTTTQTTPLGTADFTVEGWINFDNVGGNRTFITLDDSAQLYFRNSGSSIAIYGISGGTYNFSTGTPEANTWYHFAFVRQSGSITLYWDGQSKGSVGCTDNFSSGNLHIGCWSAISEFFQGHLTDIKISNTAVYTSNFSVPTERLFSDSSTKLLICHLPYIADGSTNDHSITVNGNGSKPFSPYDYNEYAADDHGGSVYTSGTESLGVSSFSSFSNIGTGDYTLECWHYNDTANSGVGLDFRDAAGIALVSSSGSLRAYYVTGTIFASTATGVITPRQWNHLVFCRISGILKGYLNGKEVFSVNDTTNLSGSSNTVYIGNNAAASSALNGYYSSVRMTNKGVYTGEFTPPTTPLSTTQSSGTNISAVASGECKLLVKGTDASIIDKSQSANLKLIGNTTGSTTQVKFSNTKSMYFDGSGDEINAGRSIIPIGFSDFTVEGWVNFSNVSGQQFICIQAPNGTTTATTFMIYLANSKIYNQWGSGSAYIETGILSANTWYHFASVHDSANSLVYFYLDGSSVGSFSSGLRSIGDYVFDIGARDSALFLNGYLQDLRVSSYARYTTNFTPPTAPLEG
jgi:hypothetical protein